MNRLRDSAGPSPLASLADISSQIRSLGSDGYSQSQGGMNQFYSAVDRPSDFGGVLDALKAGFNESGRQISTGGSNYADVMNRMGAGFNQTGQSIGSMRGDLGGGFGAIRDDINTGRREMSSLFSPTLAAIGGTTGQMQDAYNAYLADRGASARNMSDAYGQFQNSTGALAGQLGRGYMGSSSTIDNTLASNSANLGTVLGQLNNTATGNRAAFDDSNNRLGGLERSIGSAAQGAIGGINSLGSGISGAISANQSAYDDLKKTLADPKSDYNVFRNDMYGIAGRMGDSFDRGNQGIDTVLGTLGTGYQGAQQGVQDLWDKSLGSTEWFSNPVTRQAQEREAELARRRAQLEDAIYRGNNPDLQRYQPFWTPEQARRGLDSLPGVPQQSPRPGIDVFTNRPAAPARRPVYY
jgi:hypothetical protein